MLGKGTGEGFFAFLRWAGQACLDAETECVQTSKSRQARTYDIWTFTRSLCVGERERFSLSLRGVPLSTHRDGQKVQTSKRYPGVAATSGRSGVQTAIIVQPWAPSLSRDQPSFGANVLLERDHIHVAADDLDQVRSLIANCLISGTERQVHGLNAYPRDLRNLSGTERFPAFEPEIVA